MTFTQGDYQYFFIIIVIIWRSGVNPMPPTVKNWD